MHINSGLHLYKYADAPHAGARIEMLRLRQKHFCPLDAPHAGARIEIGKCIDCPEYDADAPHAGARIEIL